MAKLACGDEGPICALQEQGLKGCAVSVYICILLPQQIKALLQNSTERREASTVDQRFGKSVLIVSQRHGTLHNHRNTMLISKASMTR